MTLEGIVLGLLALAVGAAFCFMGFRFFLILLPIWAFFMGFMFGVNGMHYLFGETFLSTAIGVFIGLFVGVFFAIISYLYYWVAVVLLGASVGYSIGLGFMAFLGNGGGLLAWTVAIVFAAVAAAIVVLLRVPRYLVIILTAFGGAFAVTSGVALILGRVPKEALDAGTVGMYVKDNLSILYIIVAIVLGVIGTSYQGRETQRMESIAMESYRNPGMA